MSTKYEIIEIDQAEITVDISLLSKTEELFFNATQMAKPFGKKPKDFLKTAPTKEYIEEIFKEDLNPLKTYDDLILIRKGKYGGTWFHNELAFEFAGWCSVIFRRKLHKWVESKLKEERARKRARLEARTGHLPMTNAILNAHDPVKPHHFSNEANLLNRIVLGMPAKKFKEVHGVTSVRDACTAAQIKDLKNIQEMNTTLVKLGMDYQTRKDILTRHHNGEQVFLGEVA